VEFEVVPPEGYRGTRAHGLLVAYAGSGGTAARILDDWGLVEEADDVIVVAVEPRSPGSSAAVSELGAVIGLAEARYCVAAGRVALTGHSDGGTAAALVALDRGGVRGVAPSGAGTRPSDLDARGCPSPLEVLVLHGADDEVFPDRGEASAGWWADCFGCVDETDEDGCRVFSGCAEGAGVRFCEGSGGHSDWPSERAGDIIALLDDPGGD
jgi:poly(3-hydroxybutyrate) depolymerase